MIPTRRTVADHVENRHDAALRIKRPCHQATAPGAKSTTGASTLTMLPVIGVRVRSKPPGAILFAGLRVLPLPHRDLREFGRERVRVESRSFNRLSDDHSVAIRTASRRIFSSLRAVADHPKQRCRRDFPVITTAPNTLIGPPIPRENPETSLQRFT